MTHIERRALAAYRELKAAGDGEQSDFLFFFTAAREALDELGWEPETDDNGEERLDSLAEEFFTIIQAGIDAIYRSMTREGR